ncbi:MAG TPA: hypothetical protein VFY36_10205 [Solirubrobacteraceae bacterium]|nr:hypothetical protein [Solirubrobacteraceae bacterium]
MKRMLLTTTMTAMLAIAAPGVASAHRHGERHHRGHHAKAHRHHHHHHASPAKVRIFGTPPAPISTPPAAPRSATGETAGTVASFTNGVLTITLKDGTTVSGKVTDQTRLHCQSATSPPAHEDGEHHGDRSHGEDGDSAGRDGRDDISHEHDGRGDDGEPSCTTAALVAGTVVRGAKLRVTAAGAIWDCVALIV